MSDVVPWHSARTIVLVTLSFVSVLHVQQKPASIQCFLIIYRREMIRKFTLQCGFL